MAPVLAVLYSQKSIVKLEEPKFVNKDDVIEKAEEPSNCRELVPNFFNSVLYVGVPAAISNVILPVSSVALSSKWNRANVPRLLNTSSVMLFGCICEHPLE